MFIMLALEVKLENCFRCYPVQFFICCIWTLGNNIPSQLTLEFVIFKFTTLDYVLIYLCFVYTLPRHLHSYHKSDMIRFCLGTKVNIISQTCSDLVWEQSSMKWSWVYFGFLSLGLKMTLRSPGLSFKLHAFENIDVSIGV